MATKKYVSLEKLSLYDEKIKQHIADADSAVLQSAKTYADGLASNYDATGSANDALKTAKSYSDNLNTTMGNRVAALETDSHTHDNKDVLDNITTDNVNNWNANAVQSDWNQTDEESGDFIKNKPFGEEIGTGTVSKFFSFCEGYHELIYDKTSDQFVGDAKLYRVSQDVYPLDSLKITELRFYSKSNGGSTVVNGWILDYQSSGEKTYKYVDEYTSIAYYVTFRNNNYPYSDGIWVGSTVDYPDSLVTDIEIEYTGEVITTKQIDSKYIPEDYINTLINKKIHTHSNKSVLDTYYKTQTQLLELIQTAQETGDAAQADVDALETYVGTIPEGYSETNVVAYINKKAEETLTSATGGSSESAASVLAALNTYKSENDPKVTANTDAIAAINNTESGILAQAKAYADEGDFDVQADVTELSGKVTTLIGDDTGKSARAISAEEVAKIVAGANESYDTLKEIADWISSHTTDAAAMNSAIVALQAIVDGIGGEGESATVVAYVQSAINALSIGDYAKAADLTALAARVSALETDAHTHDNKTVLDGITAEKVSAWDAAETNAKTHADGLNTAMDTRMTAVETWQSEMIEVTEDEINALFA